MEMILSLSLPSSGVRLVGSSQLQTLQNVENPMHVLKSSQCANFCSHKLDLQSGSEIHSCFGPYVKWDAHEWLFWRTEPIWRTLARVECQFFTPVYQQFNLPFFYHVMLNETLLPHPSYVKLVGNAPPQEQACGAGAAVCSSPSF